MSGPELTPGGLDKLLGVLSPVRQHLSRSTIAASVEERREPANACKGLGSPPLGHPSLLKWSLQQLRFASLVPLSAVTRNFYPCRSVAQSRFETQPSAMSDWFDAPPGSEEYTDIEEVGHGAFSEVRRVISDRAPVSLQRRRGSGRASGFGPN